MTEPDQQPIWKIFLFVFILTFLPLATLEGILQVFPAPDPYLPPAKVHKFLPAWNNWVHGEQTPPFSSTADTGRLSGVSTTRVDHTVNKYGFLYDDDLNRDKAPNELRIAVVGGSAVECGALREDKRLTAVLQSRLSGELKDRKIIVYNMGADAQDTRSFLATTAQLAVKLNLDYIVFLIGGTDLFQATHFDLLNDTESFVIIDPAEKNLQARLKWWATRFQIVRRMRQISKTFFARDDRPYFLDGSRPLSELPLLTAKTPTISQKALDDYELNLKSLEGIAAAHHIKAIFVTEPALWKKSMTKAEIDVDWLGVLSRDGKIYRLRGEDSANLLDQLNERTMDVCRREQIRCLDLAGKMARTFEYFYDSVHFNESGARYVAEQMGNIVLQDLTNISR